MVGHTKAVKSGDRVEVWEYERPVSASSRSRSKPRASVGRRLINKRFANARTKRRSFERLVRANMLDHRPLMATLTMREAVPLEEAWRAFKKFAMRVRYRHPDFRYIIVPEWQKRGAVHFHALIWGVSSEYVETERATRYFASIWGHGFIDLIKTDGSNALVGYLSKYMLKAMRDERLFNQKAYCTSRNILRPVSLKGRTQVGYSSEVWGIELSTGNDRTHQVTFQKEYVTKYMGRCVYKVYDLIT